MHTPFRTDAQRLHPVLLDRAAETIAISAWLAVPLFALLSGGALAPPLHAAGIATLLTLALRSWRSARRGQALEQLRERLVAYLAEPTLRPVAVQVRPRHRRRRRFSPGITLALPALGPAAAQAPRATPIPGPTHVP